MKPRKPYLRPGRAYNPRGGRPPLDVDFVAVCDAIRGAWSGSGETVTSIAAGFGVSRGWIHKCVYPAIAGDGNGESRDPAASAENGPALPPLDDKVCAEIQQDIKVDVTGGGGPVKLHRR